MPKPDRHHLYYATTLFRNRVLESNGTAYEALVCQVLELRSSTFERVKTQGTFGDGGNDGYDKEIGLYYQVYAPERPEAKEAEACAKAVKDFDKLRAFWEEICPIREYRFAFNDKFLGTKPTLERDLAALKRAKSLESATVFTARHLQNEFEALTLEQMSKVIGYVPDGTGFPGVDECHISDILTHVLQAPAPVLTLGSLVVPDFDDKLTYNQLDDSIQVALRSASQQIGLVEGYFAVRGSFDKQRTRNVLNEEYTRLKSTGLGPDETFQQLLLWMLPEEPRMAHQHAGTVILAFFFESCDVFEDPGGSDAAS